MLLLFPLSNIFINGGVFGFGDLLCKSLSQRYESTFCHGLAYFFNKNEKKNFRNCRHISPLTIYLYTYSFYRLQNGVLIVWCLWLFQFQTFSYIIGGVVWFWWFVVSITFTNSWAMFLSWIGVIYFFNSNRKKLKIMLLSLIFCDHDKCSIRIMYRISY